MPDFKRFAFILLMLLSFVACRPDDDGTTSGQFGHVQLFATDAPFNYENVISAKVTISKIDMREKSGNYVVVDEGERTLDLIQLKNGLTETLADMTIPVAEYDQVRLVIESASVDLEDGRHFDLTVPSGSSSGLKVFVSPAINVTSSVSSSLLLDFDLSRSFVAQGTAEDITGFSFKPAIRASNLTTAGSVSGIVIGDQNSTPEDGSDDVALAGAIVILTDAGGTVTATAVTDATGFYKMIGLPVGTYTMATTFEGYGPEETSGVNVVTGNETKINLTLDLVGGE